MPSFITPDFEPHKELEQDVRRFLHFHNFVEDDLTYHGKTCEKFRNRLKNMYTPTSLYLRGRSDRTALHETFDIAFQWEAKTHAPGRYHDCCLEALPLIHHLNALCAGVDCLYAYRDSESQTIQDRGFWVSRLPPLRTLFMPSRWEKSPRILLWFQGMFAKFFPGIRIRSLWGSRGSGDPYVVIDEKEISSCTHWYNLVVESVENKGHLLPLPTTFRKHVQGNFYGDMT